MLSPEGLIKSPAFSNVAVVSGAARTIYVGGQDAVDADGNIVGEGDLAAQTAQILRNIKVALAAAGARPEHVIKWTVFVVDGQDFATGYSAFQTEWGRQPNPPPVITAAVVKGLARPEFLVEMDAIAVVPES
jgi:enamine deaminase RidA (YjgF/YER057c/UK114 family)